MKRNAATCAKRGGAPALLALLALLTLVLESATGFISPPSLAQYAVSPSGSSPSCCSRGSSSIRSSSSSSSNNRGGSRRARELGSRLRVAEDVSVEGGSIGVLTDNGSDGFPATLSLGAPRHRPGKESYTTKGGVHVKCEVVDVPDPQVAVEGIVAKLDEHQGVLLTSSYEYPGRYARWTIGFVDPPIEVTGKGSTFKIRALNDRGRVLLPAFKYALKGHDAIGTVVEADGTDGASLEGTIAEREGFFSEEERSLQPSLFGLVRALVQLFGFEDDPQLGLYGAFGYDLTFQFEPIEQMHARDPEQSDLVLYLPDEVLVVDEEKRDAWKIKYDFAWKGKGKGEGEGEEEGGSTEGLERTGHTLKYEASTLPPGRDTPEGLYSKKVERAREEFKVGNLFEVVLSQTFKEPCKSPPSEVFRRLRSRNPSPYGFFINLGKNEYLVGASPEMFVRCEKTGEGLRVETCPISGTIARGSDPMEDACNVLELLASAKEESELTMCTDVDRNDKSRICKPGSVAVIGRRQIEMYSRLIHTVDHVEGYLRPEFDALDAFLCHTWAVTVTGAPKTWAIKFVEKNEESPRDWYGGAVGLVGFDGHLNTGLTLRTVRIKNGMAEVRAGATLLWDSEPAAEEAETELKASAMIDAVVRTGNDVGAEEELPRIKGTGEGKNVLLIDHEDSFVHTLGNYLRQTGAKVTTVRSGEPLRAFFADLKSGDKSTRPLPDLVVLSPGPGNPTDFDLSGTISALLELRLPAFGVCLGLQGMVEHFGGELGVLSYPMHGKPSSVALVDRSSHRLPVFDGLPDSFGVARYHSLYGLTNKMPSCLRPTAVTEDGVVMAVEHTSLPFAAVQFHPESILTNEKHGLSILANCLSSLQYPEDGG